MQELLGGQCTMFRFRYTASYLPVAKCFTLHLLLQSRRSRVAGVGLFFF